MAERGVLSAQLSAGPLGVEASDVGTGDRWYVSSDRDRNLDPLEVAAKKARIQAVLDAGSPHEETKAYRRQRDKRIEELEESLRKDVVPRGYYHLKRQDSTDYNKVVSEVAKQLTDSNRRALEDELKNLRREREPNDPNAGNLSYLREDRRIAV